LLRHLLLRWGSRLLLLLVLLLLLHGRSLGRSIIRRGLTILGHGVSCGRLGLSLFLAARSER
jgi:hypothetical protein